MELVIKYPRTSMLKVSDLKCFSDSETFKMGKKRKKAINIDPKITRNEEEAYFHDLLRYM